MIVLPALAGVVIAALPKGRDDLAKQLALAVSLVVLLLAVLATVAFDPNGPRFQLTTSVSWIPAFGVDFALGVDGIALVMLLLIGVLMPIVIAASWRDTPTGTRSMRAFFAWLMLLEAAMVGGVRRDRRLRVLRLLRGDADPDVLPDRQLRRAATAVRRDEVLRLQPRGRPDHARLGDRALRRQQQPARPRHVRLRRPARPRDHSRRAEAAVPRFLHRVRHQGAADPAAHLAARRRCRGAYRRGGPPRRGAGPRGGP